MSNHEFTQPFVEREISTKGSGSFRQRPLRVEAGIIIQHLNLAFSEKTAVGRASPRFATLSASLLEQSAYAEKLSQ